LLQVSDQTNFDDRPGNNVAIEKINVPANSSGLAIRKKAVTKKLLKNFKTFIFLSLWLILIFMALSS